MRQTSRSSQISTKHQTTKTGRKWGNRRRNRRRTTNRSTNYKVDTFDFRFQGGVIGIVRGTFDQVKKYLMKHVPNRNALVAAGVSTHLDPSIMSLIFLKGNIDKGFDINKLIPKSVLTQAFQAASFYRGVPIQFTWTNMISWMSNSIKIGLLDDTGISQKLARYFLNNLVDLVFDNGYVRGVKDYRTNTLLLINPDTNTSRLTFAWDGLNFGQLPTVTEKPVRNAVFGDNVLLQAEFGGNYLYSLPVDQIAGYLSRQITKLDWIKSDKFGSITDISVVPVDTGINTLIVSLKPTKDSTTYQLVNIGFENGVPTMVTSDQFQVPTDVLPKSYDRIVRVSPNLVTTISQDDTVGFLPINVLPPAMGQPISQILTPPVEPTAPSVM